jgi:hypothetical protein
LDFVFGQLTLSTLQSLQFISEATYHYGEMLWQTNGWTKCVPLIEVRHNYLVLMFRKAKKIQNLNLHKHVIMHIIIHVIRKCQISENKSRPV